jgi:hypothetical protein
VPEAEPRRQSQGISGGPQVSSSAPAGKRRKGPIGGRHFGPRSGRLGGCSGKGPRFRNDRFRESGSVRCGATGSACERVVRLARRDNTPTRGLTPPKKNRGGLLLTRSEVRATKGRDWCGGANPLHHSGSGMPSGYPVPLRTARVQTQHKRVGGWPDRGRRGQ